MSRQPSSYPVVSIINFNHARGPEVEEWIGIENESDVSEWPWLPFLALTDGAHSSTEDFSYFTLKHTGGEKPTTLFGISCTRQLDSRELIERPAEVTRSTVQKAVVVIADNPTIFFGSVKQQLSAVTQAWFAQKNFQDFDILKRFQESLKLSLRLSQESGNDRDHFVGLSLREIIYEFKHQALVLFKCMLLQPKMLFFGLRGERLCMTQFSLISLIPELLHNLQDSSDPELDSYESTLTKPTSVRTSDRKSLLAFMGQPLQIFGKGSLFGPYTPLQQLDVLADVGTKSYIVGSTNSLLLQQKDRYSDILINLEDMTVNITSSSLRTALALSAADRRWIDSLVQSVSETWDETDPSRPKSLGFVGSEDHIRLQFEEYILSMVSAVKYQIFLEKHTGSDSKVFLPDIEGDPSADFNPDFVDYWKKTDNYRIFQKFTEPEIFDLVPPKHVMAGGLTVEDVQRRIAQQIHDLGLDEKVSAGKETMAKAVATGRNNLSLAFTNISKNVEYYREQRRIQALQAQAEQLEAEDAASINTVETDDKDKDKATVPEKNSTPSILSASSTAPTSPTAAETPGKPGAAGAYISSWASWAGEKKKAFAGAKSPEVPGSPEPEGVISPSARSSIFSRWSRSSQDLTPRSQPKDDDPRSSGETTRVLWDENEAVQAKEKKLPAIRKSLPPPPLPAKDSRVEVDLPATEEEPLPVPTQQEQKEVKEVKEDVVTPVEKSVELEHKPVEEPKLVEEELKPVEEPKPVEEVSEPVQEQPIRRSIIEPAQARAVTPVAMQEPQVQAQKTPEMKPAQPEEKVVMQPLSPGVTVRRPMKVDRKPLSPEKPVLRSPSLENLVRRPTAERPTRTPLSPERSVRTPLSPERPVRKPLSIDRTPQEKPIEHRPLRRPTSGFAARHAAAAEPEVPRSSPKPQVPMSLPKPEPSPPAIKPDDVPKVDSIVKRLSLKLGAETAAAADPNPSSPTSPTKRTAPSAAAIAKQNSIAARRAMFEKR